ncbi:MAG TPA: hypothetical protein VMS22_02590 [Candidatus Eisenbacteria bacterium]|nr:hypothetical protein [Candidatus Eisenbacteria bacterium]
MTSRLVRSLTALACLGLVEATADAATRPGDLDPTFGSGGIARRAVSRGQGNDVLALPDGSVIVGGTGDPEGDGVRKFVLVRFDAQGLPLLDFGDAGLVHTRLPLADGAVVRRLALDPDGKVVAAGITTTLLGTGETSRLLIMTRYFTDGVFDRDFGIDGFRNSALAREVAGLAVRPDRTIDFAATDDDFVGGSLPLGSGSGIFFLDGPSSGADVLEQSDAVVYGGTERGDFVLFRLLGGSDLDPNFGTDGIVTTSLGAGSDSLRKLLGQADGKIVGVGGTTVAPGDHEFAVVRYAVDGTLDPTFGDGGVTVTAIGPGRDDPFDAVLGPDGSIVVVGQTCEPGVACTGVLARFLTDGRLDPAFGDGGLAIGRTPPLFSVAMPDDGHVVATVQSTDELLAARFVVATCGNGRVESGEACDDGNTADGDCCSAACTLEADESPCDDDGSACTADVCRAGTCAHVVPVEAGCTAADTSALSRVPGGNAGDRLRWTWQSATPVGAASFGDPTAATDLTLCLVDGADETDHALAELTIPGAATCGAGPCWKETPRGFRYRDPAAAQDGVSVLRLASTAAGSRITLKAKGLPEALQLPAALRVRLVRGDAPTCFEADLAPARGATFRSAP